MKRYSKFLLLGMIFATLVALIVPVSAQDGVGPGEGGTIIESNFGGDANTFNPLIGNDTVSSNVYTKLFPDIIGLDPVTLLPTPNVPNGLAESWEYDETGTVLTIHIRQDMFWSDGEQINADDWIWAVNAVKSGTTSSPRTSALYQLDDGTVTEGPIHSVTKIDDFTVEVRLGNVQKDADGNVVLDDAGNPVLIPNCDAITDIDDIAVVPEHIFSAQFGTDYAGMDADPFFVPQSESGFGTFGAFTDPFIEFGVQVSLVADQNYTDATGDYVVPGEWIMQNVEDSTIEYERFLAGDYSFLSVSPDHQNEIRAMEGFQTIEYPSNGYTYMGYNTADPSNPQPGRDDAGNLIDQGIHPIFGDVRVRQAIAHAVDVIAMIGTRPEGDQPATGILEGNGYPIATNDHPGLSTTADLLEEMGVVPYSYDPDLAKQMLEEAGWTDEDGNGVRECHGCLYAETHPDYEGTEMQFELLTNAGNRVREATGETIRAQLEEVGIVVNFQAIEFGTLVDELLAQQFDAIIIGWNLGAPFVGPGGSLKNFFSIGNDIPGSGFNLASYHNEEFDALVDQADTLPGCDPAERNALYAEAQKMLWEDQPYLWLFAGNVLLAAQSNVEGWDPVPYNFNWNMDAWSIGEGE